EAGWPRHVLQQRIGDRHRRGVRSGVPPRAPPAAAGVPVRELPRTCRAARRGRHRPDRRTTDRPARRPRIAVRGARREVRRRRVDVNDPERVTVRVAEHRSFTERSDSPSDADLQLARRLAEQQMLTVRWLADQRVEIVSNSWVGVVRFSNLDVLVEPKLVGGNLRVLRMLEYAAGIDLARELHVDRPLPADGSDLFELVCMLLAREVNRLLLDGVLR